MRTLRCVSRLWLGLVLAAVTACAGAREVSAAARESALAYRLSIPEPASQYAQLELSVKDIPGRHVDLAMPAWTPGSYLVRDFGRHVHDLRAVGSGAKALRVEQRDKQTWRVHHAGRPFTVSYRVFADELSCRTSHIDDRAAHLNGTTLFLYLPGELDRPVQVDVQPPPGWSLHVALPAKAGPSGTVRLEAPDYDALVDAPMMLGTFETRTFDVDGTRFEYVLWGAKEANADVERLVSDAQRVAVAFGEFMGGFPTPRYVFLSSINRAGGGGLEHANSTMMMMRRSAFHSDGGYGRAARLAAHEFFHLWNVKRIRDAALVPYDFAREDHTRLLWFHEGFTETAESLAILRAGLVDPKDHVAKLGRSWTRHLRRPGRNVRPIADESFDAWTRHYKKAANSPNVSVSYYAKGDLIGVALDLEIRRRSAGHGRPSDLFGVFRRLMKSHGDRGRGITHRDIVEATSAEAGEDMTWFFERFVTGRGEVPLPALLPAFGVEVREHRPWENPDGSSRDADAVAVARTYSGIDWSGTSIDNVRPKSPATAAGLMRGDEVVAIDGRRVASESAAKRALARVGPGEAATLHIFRDGALRQVQVQLTETPYRDFEFRLMKDEALDPSQRSLRKAWLGV